MASRSAEYHRKARLENPEHYKQKDKKRYLARAEKQKSLQKKNRIDDPQSYILRQVKSRSKRLGLDFDLKREDIVIPEICPILLIPLVVGNSKICDNSPSLDRVDNTKGYVKGNVQVISFKANRCKSNLSFDEKRRMYEYTCRYKQKGGVQDLKKVIHYAELLIKSLEQGLTPEEKLQELLYDKGLVTKAAQGPSQLDQNPALRTTDDPERDLSVRLYE